MPPRPAALVAAVLLGSGLAYSAPGHARFTTFGEIRPTLTALAETLPAELKADSPSQLESAWNTWIARHDAEIRARLKRGDEETIVNWLLFGTSFTSRPRALVDPPADGIENPSRTSSDDTRLAELIAGRAGDLTAALTAPGRDERRLFARTFFQNIGYRLEIAAERRRLEQHLVAEVARIARERSGYAAEVAAVRQLPDATEQFAVRSKLFRNRGVSLDTSIAPNFALERALQHMLSTGILRSAGVKRMAVIGPGLDFADKAAGLDIYPQQTLQPFAVADALFRLGLSVAADLDIVTFDISPRVNDHLARARMRAQSGSPYLLRLPLDSTVAWKPELIDYWKRLGDRIGVAVREPKLPALAKDEGIRTLHIRPQIVSRLVPENVNIVAQRLDGAPFDLVVATNVFVYYDTLDQTLGLAAVEAMLRPGGCLLSNNALLELPASRLRSAGYLTVQYSDRLDDGDHIVWYRRES